MIIFGWRTRESTTGAGTFVCPVCRSAQVFRRVTYRRWFTLYFLPVIPLGQVGEQFQCRGCLQRFSHPPLSLPSDEAPGVTALADDGSGMPSPFAAPREWAPARTSSLAVASLICGLLSPLFLLACNLSLFTSLAAIVTGHLARREINRSGGRVGGNGQALAGLIAGYLLLAVSTAVLVVFLVAFRHGWEQARESSGNGQASAREASAETAAGTSSERLRDAEFSTLTAGPAGPATGNTPRARQLAADYSRSLKAMRETLFSAERDRIFRLTDGQFVVHCELHEDRCAFIVHVPAYRDFSAEAKETLAIGAWQIAQQAVASALEPGAELAVGLRGTVLYGAVMTGRVTSDEEQRGVFAQGERDALLAFFPSPGLDGEEPMADDGLPGKSPSEQADSPPELPNEADEPQSLPQTAPEPIPQMPPQLAHQLPPQPALQPAPQSPPPLAARIPAPVESPLNITPSVPRAAQELDIQLVHRFPEMGWQIQSLAFSADSRWLAAGKMDRTVLIFDMETGRRLAEATELRDLGQVECLAFAPDSGFLLAGGSSGLTQVWPLEPSGQLGTAVPLYRHARAARVLVTSSASRFLLSGGADGMLAWQTYGREPVDVRTLKAFERNVLAVHLPTAGFEALATDGRALLRFDLRRATESKPQPLARSGVHAAAFSDDGTQLAISTGSELRLWDTASCQELQTLKGNAGEIQWSVRYHPHRRWLISGGRGQAHVWDLETARSLATIDLGGVLYIQVLAISPDGRLLAAIPSAAGQTLTVVRLPDAADALPAN